MRYIRAIFKSVINVLRQLNWRAKLLLILLAIAVFSAGSIVVTGQPSFCNSCHIMNSYYDSWQTSSHSNVNCLDCHLQPGFAGYIKGKINGLAQAVDCMVGRVGTKPNATVEDTSCMRSECHSSQELISANIDYEGIKFSHNNHITKVVDGIRISCGTCHSHFSGDEHFTVNNEVCFTCHFLKSDESGERLVQTGCRDCHEVPGNVIERGLVTVDHAEYVTYSATCEDSCHKREIEKISEVSDSVCLNCHSFGKERQADSVKLHESHTNHEKVECFACHGKISHGQTKVASVSEMMDCRNCHSDTHQVQRIIYTTKHPMQDENTQLVLSPMFLTHVECSGCHIERVAKHSPTLDSLGTVAKAVPGACDNCHEEGTGERYIPFWQGKIKGLYEQVRQRLDKLDEQAKLERDEKHAQRLHDVISNARSILDSVTSDGSWGVHNFKYTEALLLKANKIIIEVE
ncbi:MAG: hypothetical protein GWN55_07020 [Phycisphaerae bacterium]|nr:hypothetical protein [Phycisphaerae bacterium]